MVKQANTNSIPIIEGILLDAVNWMTINRLENKWNNSNVKWINLSKQYKVTDFYIAYDNYIPAACMALTDYDQTYWPDIPKGESLYLHKFAVKRSFAGKGFSKELIDYAKNIAHELNIKTIRLNCNLHRNKLRSTYEKEGFVYIGEKTIRTYDIALYVCTIES